MKNAFPKKYEDIIEQFTSKIDFEDSHFNDYTEEYYINNECVQIPYRIYINENILEISQIDSTIKRLLLCYFTRHHNGYVRQKCLKQLINSDIIYDYEIPYILRLCGEYVIEILIDAYVGINLFEYESIRKYVKQNYTSLELMEARMISYWNENYRRRTYGIKFNPDYVEWDQYPAHKILGFLKKFGYSTNR